ncbi:Type IV pilus assembly protein PilX [Shewanella piezotolerans WP3]|uniref:Type IV pilus assembly protein PilX n=1 Tax=Shewanella piezotolerans (strain WP3 / JCM 13877) TaxID=225849 RepID=B8CSB5_SHEPW|nr:Type IV pilus assembly protein PilX [Shewanella piezotolerans WP3]
MLFFSIIILLIMTVIGVALAVNSTQSIRMAGAGSERIEAMANAHGAQDRLINSNEGTTFASLPANPADIADSEFTVTSSLTVLSDDGACIRTSQATQPDMIGCVTIEISSQATFGRNNMGQLTVVSGIEQEILGATGN